MLFGVRMFWGQVQPPSEVVGEPGYGRRVGSFGAICLSSTRLNTVWPICLLLSARISVFIGIWQVDDDQLYHPFLLQRMLAISAEIPGATGHFDTYGDTAYKCSSFGGSS